MSKARLPEDRNGASQDLLARWQAVEAALRAHFENPDIEAAQILFACVAAHRITDYPPVWDMLIAPSGSMKTALLDSLQGLKRVYFVDEVTQNTFISGKVDDRGKAKRKTPASLLHRIGDDGILVVADFSTVLAFDNRKKPAILAQLRRIYDGFFVREFGTGENLDEHKWRGRLTLLAGVTPEFDRHHSVFHSLGERFLRTRWPRAGGIETAMRAINQQSSTALRLRNAVRDLLAPILEQAVIIAPILLPEHEHRLAHLGELIALARADVPRERENHAICDVPAAEGNTRLPQQFAQIARGWAVLEGSESTTESGMKLVQRVAFDCIPPAKRAVIQALTRGQNPYAVKLAPSLVSRAIEDLEAVGLIEKKDKTARLTPLAQTLLIGSEITFPQSGVDTEGE
jgi:hypothetical protein